MKKLGFALGAGGARGVAHVGFIKAMEENGIIPDYISGTSMGSVVGACYAKGMSADQMISEIRKLKFSEIFDLSFNPIGNGALLRASKMRKKLEKYLANLTFNDLKIPFTAVATDLCSGHPVAFSGDKKVVDCVVASSSIPTIFKPCVIDDVTYVDGGITVRVPVNQVKDMGAEVVVGVDVLGDIKETNKRFNIMSVMMRMIEVMDCQVARYRIKEDKPNVLIVPDLGDMSQYKFKGLDTAFEIGYKTGLENVKKIKRLIKD